MGVIIPTMGDVPSAFALPITGTVMAGRGRFGRRTGAFRLAESDIDLWATEAALAATVPVTALRLGIAIGDGARGVVMDMLRGASASNVAARARRVLTGTEPTGATVGFKFETPIGRCIAALPCSPAPSIRIRMPAGSVGNRKAAPG